MPSADVWGWRSGEEIYAGSLPSLWKLLSLLASGREKREKEGYVRMHLNVFVG